MVVPSTIRSSSWAVDAGGFQRAHGGVVGEVAGGLAFGGDVALADAGARGDPFVAGIDELRQVVVGQHLFRQIAAGAGDTREHLLGHAVCSVAI